MYVCMRPELPFHNQDDLNNLCAINIVDSGVSSLFFRFPLNALLIWTDAGCGKGVLEKRVVVENGFWL